MWEYVRRWEVAGRVRCVSTPPLAVPIAPAAASGHAQKRIRSSRPDPYAMQPIYDGEWWWWWWWCPRGDKNCTRCPTSNSGKPRIRPLPSICAAAAKRSERWGRILKILKQSAERSYIQPGPTGAYMCVCVCVCVWVSPVGCSASSQFTLILFFFWPVIGGWCKWKDMHDQATRAAQDAQSIREKRRIHFVFVCVCVCHNNKNNTANAIRTFRSGLGKFCPRMRLPPWSSRSSRAAPSAIWSPSVRTSRLVHSQCLLDGRGGEVDCMYRCCNTSFLDHSTPPNPFPLHPKDRKFVRTDGYVVRLLPFCRTSSTPIDVPGTGFSEFRTGQTITHTHTHTHILRVSNFPIPHSKGEDRGRGGGVD